MIDDKGRDEIEKVANDLMNKFVQEGLPDDLGYRISIRPYIVDTILAQVEKARETALEEAAKIAEEHLIYTGPGGFDPEPIQAILAKQIRNKLENQQGE